MNQGFYFAALKMLKSGMTGDEFATNYANASNEKNGSDSWNSIFGEGKEAFSKFIDIVDENNTVDEKEINLFANILSHIKNAMSIKDWNCHVDRDNCYLGNSKTERATKISVEGREDITSEFAELLGDKELSINLKPVDQLTLDEVKDELKNLNPALDIEGKDENELKLMLYDYRNFIIDNDENSRVIDYHIGTFRQNGQGTCGPLAQFVQLSDDILKRMITECEDENGKYYKVVFPFDEGDESKVQIVRQDELEAGIISVEHNGQEHRVGAFSEGDYDALLLEIAFTKRFGYDMVVQGTNTPFINQVFTYPDEEQPSGHLQFVTEEALEDALSKGHVTTSLFASITQDEECVFITSFVSESGMTAHWEVSNRNVVERELKQRFPEIDEYKYKDLNDEDFMTFVMLLEEDQSSVEYGNVQRVQKFDASNFKRPFTYTQQLKLSNGQTFRIGHCYSIKSYDKENKEVVLINPWANNEEIVIPYDIFEKYFLI